MQGQVTIRSISAAERLVMHRLRAAADPVLARRARTYFKRDVVFVALGVAAPELRRVAKEVAQAAASHWDIRQAAAFCDRMSRRRPHEAKAVGVLVLGRFRREFPRELLGIARTWVEEGRFANWAAIDLLCPEVLTPLVQRYPGLDLTVRRWAGADLLWLRRAAAVTFVPLARRGDRLDSAYDVALRLKGEGADLVQKACGWLLREAGRSDPDRLERFLTKHGRALPRTSVRYAIERFPEPVRARLLRQTREG